jgi:two-component system sensor kinase FixL
MRDPLSFLDDSRRKSGATFLRRMGLALLDSAWAQLERDRRGFSPFARYALVSALYLLAYIGTNFVTEARNFEHSSITLWSPDNGLSLLLLIESVAYAPVVLMASIAVDLIIGNVNYNIFVVIGSETILTLGYISVSIVLRHFFHFEKWARSYANTIAVLAVIPASAAITGFTYCGFLFLTRAIPVGQLYSAISNFWIGDTVGMIVVLPAATAIHDFVANSRWRQMASFTAAITMVFVGALIIFFMIVSVENIRNQYLFNIIYLPMIWLGVNYGFNAVSFMLLFTQMLLVLTLAHYRIDNYDFTTFQTLMFIMAATGQLLGAVITEREQTARQLRQQQAELSRVSAQATTGAMAVTMAHEISQPLSSLASYVHSARRMIDGAQPAPAVRAALVKAEAEAGRARQIIERIRDFVSSGRLEVEVTEIGPISTRRVRAGWTSSPRAPTDTSPFPSTASRSNRRSTISSPTRSTPPPRRLARKAMSPSACTSRMIR